MHKQEKRPVTQISNVIWFSLKLQEIQVFGPTNFSKKHFYFWLRLADMLTNQRKMNILRKKKIFRKERERYWK